MSSRASENRGSRGDTGRIPARVRSSRSLAAVILVALAAFLASASSAGAATASPAWELQVIHGPTNVPIVPSVNEVQTVTIVGEAGGVPNDGKFKLDFENPDEVVEHTKYLPFNATAAEVQSALEVVKIIGANNVQVSGGPKAPGEASWTYTITFVGALAGQEFASIETENEVTSAEEAKVEKKGEESEAGEAEAAIVTTNGFHDTVIYQLIPTNLGGAPTSGKITITDTLPAGLTTKNTPLGGGTTWTCKPAGIGQSTVTCKSETPINPDSQGQPITIEAYVDPEAIKEGVPLQDKATIEGGGTTSGVEKVDSAPVSSTPARFGIYSHSMIAAAYGPKGEKFTQAGGRPYFALSSFFFNTVTRRNTEQRTTEVVLPGNVKDANVTLPAGFIGNPLATENAKGEVDRCPQAVFTEGTKGGPVGNGSCPPQDQVGSVWININELGSEPTPAALYNLVPPPGAPAELGFIFKNVPVRIDAHVVREPDGEYRVVVLSTDINSAFNVIGVTVALWGLPSDPSHTAERYKVGGGRGAETPLTTVPFLTNPTDCLAQAEEAPVTAVTYDSWEMPGPLESQGNPLPGGANWLTETAPSPTVTGCDKLKFEPSIKFAPASTRAAAPSGYNFNLEVPQHEVTTTLATPDLKDTTVTLPPGVTLSPSAANGLVACTDEQIDIPSTGKGNCPPASQVGTVSIVSQLLEQPLSGRVYVGKPECEPCGPAEAENGKLFRLFIEAEGSGVRVKLPGHASVNTTTGQVTTTFANNPQTPFEKLELKLKGGPGATLQNPVTCGSYQVGASLTPWSIGGTTAKGVDVPGDPVASANAAFGIDWNGAGEGCPAGLAFAPTFQAGTENSTAGAYSPFDVVFTRGDDREQDLAGTTVVTPPGLLGKIAGIPRCDEANANKGTCPADSRIATATSVAGAGTTPFTTSGPVYLTGEYKGAPFGLSIVVPAKAGPFDLGTVVVRAAISIDPITSAITITSDPLPQSVDGVPFRLKQVEVKVDRPEFMFNPTNCERKEISATLTGAPAKAGEAGIAAGRSVPFTASNCAGLSFAPKLTAKAAGNFTKLLGTSFSVRLEQHPGESHIRKVQLQLPVSLPSRLETLHEACRDTVFAVNPASCPTRAVVGTATAVTPLLAAPLTGPAILVSHANAAFPDLVFLLQGEGVHIQLVGNTDIKKGITYSRFETVPDAPITSFETTFPNGRYSILTGYGNLCAAPLLAPTTIVAQNGLQLSQATQVAVTGCPPSVSITRVVVKGGFATVTVKLSKAGNVKIAGPGLRTLIKRGLSAGTHQIRVGLSRAGKAAARAHKKIKVQASLTAAGQTVSNSVSVKA
jgi:uncharacterized repeat protein (TIGR01451 family)